MTVEHNGRKVRVTKIWKHAGKYYMTVVANELIFEHEMPGCRQRYMSRWGVLEVN